MVMPEKCNGWHQNDLMAKTGEPESALSIFFRQLPFANCSCGKNESALAFCPFGNTGDKPGTGTCGKIG
jgi:hypothetical protein